MFCPWEHQADITALSPTLRSSTYMPGVRSPSPAPPSNSPPSGNGGRGGHLNQWCKPEHCHTDRVTWLMHWPVGRRDERKEVEDERQRRWIAQRTRPRKSRPCSVTRPVLCSPAQIRGWKYFTADELLKAQREKGGSEGHTDGQTRERGGNKLCNKLSEGKDGQQQK